ncbi:hypothetical protein G7047_21165 [Diaphorobacter sp. HDW4A]|uniref:glycosyltransferase family 2 protein n=1 Tax=Diaphorobacter sp. HDW4A TaxID=2714924 RepID=UPI00140B57B5|nr:glycosyltransferase [Diaphorobacter sp. HDW4A]QIL82160.1 hypothetical protein G7047_21165 [Diaphorobacter sp. HDW4A]
MRDPASGVSDAESFEAFNRQTLIAIPVYNRAGCLLRLLASMYACQSLLAENVHVFDDASEEFDAVFLRRNLHPASQLICHVSNSGRADQAVARIFDFFLQSSYQQVLLLDSDLLVADDMLQTAWRGFAQSEGLLSLFNTPNHPSSAQLVPEGLLLKHSVGFAGTLWGREVVTDLVANVPVSNTFDWDICRYLSGRRAIWCLLESRVQHVGSEGQNSRRDHFDYGVGFNPGNMVTANLLARETEKIILALQNR